MVEKQQPGAFLLGSRTPRVAWCSAMNEKTWERVAEWEQLHCAACPDPRLLRFRGRPDDLRSASQCHFPGQTCWHVVRWSFLK